MKIGVGLPTTLDVDGRTVVAWARRAEERGFDALTTVDRIVYPNYDTMTTLSVAAGATNRIRLQPNILLAPVYPAAWLAKASASLDELSGGRLTLGLGVGGRPDDFAAAGAPFERRGKVFDETLDLLTRAWAGEPVEGDVPVVPAAARRPVDLLVGGSTDAAIQRTVRYAAGWTGGGAGPDGIGAFAARVREAWHAGGREGEPRIGALAYYGLGDDAAVDHALGSYYAFLGESADMVVRSALRTEEAIAGAVAAFEAAGVTELALNPTVPSLDQVDRLADVVR